jgi:hypothetical protein
MSIHATFQYFELRWVFFMPSLLHSDRLTCATSVQASEPFDTVRFVLCSSFLMSGSCSGYFHNLSSREQAFMRALIHSDYTRRRVQIAMHKIIFMHSHPGEEFLVNFNYNQPSGAGIHFLRPHYLEAELSVHLGRLARAGGRMEIWDGFQSKCRYSLLGR